MNTLTYPQRKKTRARIIADYVRRAGYRGVVCFSCGHASQALIDEGLFTVDISDTGPLKAQAWYEPAEIRKIWPDLFDATSGHLPAALMVEIAHEIRREIGPLSGEFEVPTGSGETIICLKIAFPDVEFIPVYNIDRGTQYEPGAPLNDLVRSMFGPGLNTGR